MMAASDRKKYLKRLKMSGVEVGKAGFDADMVPV